jgi:hypothetical protein
MLYASLTLNAMLLCAVGYFWFVNHERKGASERTAREFELMLQAQEAEQRTELLELHAQLQQLRHRLGGHVEERHEARPN